MIRVKDWADFQHYKNRQPPWIRLYGKLLDDPEWFSLQGRASWVLASCWLIAREDANKDGGLPAIAKLAFRLRISEEELTSYIIQLNHWLEYEVGDLLAPCKQLATPETETETDNSETDNSETELPPPAVSSNGSSKVQEGATKYTFESGVIRLKEGDFRKWQEGFSHLDLRAELLALSEWAERQPKWFHAVSGALAKRNREQKIKLEQARSGPIRHTAADPMAGII